MGNKVKVMFDIAGFEPVIEDSENKLVGGFSASVAQQRKDEPCVDDPNPSNNCLGANCATGCGGGQILNGVAGCG